MQSRKKGVASVILREAPTQLLHTAALTTSIFHLLHLVT